MSKIAYKIAKRGKKSYKKLIAQKFISKKGNCLKNEKKD